MPPSVASRISNLQNDITATTATTATAACGAFKLDMAASAFGMCLCGWPKAAHDKGKGPIAPAVRSQKFGALSAQLGGMFEPGMLRPGGAPAKGALGADAGPPNSAAAQIGSSSSDSMALEAMAASAVLAAAAAASRRPKLAPLATASQPDDEVAVTVPPHLDTVLQRARPPPRRLPQGRSRRQGGAVGPSELVIDAQTDAEAGRARVHMTATAATPDPAEAAAEAVAASRLASIIAGIQSGEGYEAANSVADRHLNSATTPPTHSTAGSIFNKENAPTDTRNIGPSTGTSKHKRKKHRRPKAQQAQAVPAR